MSAQVTVAVDANGADLGPAEVARGAALAAQRGVRIILFGPAGELSAAGVEVVDAPVSIAKAPDPARSVRSTPAGTSPSSAAGPNSSTRVPAAAASAAPRATSAGPLSAPFASTATVTLSLIHI